MSVLESNLDENITSDVFSNYLNVADFTPPKNKAIISYGKSYASGDDENDFITVDATPGGALMKDLSFCGTDKQQGCTFGELEDGVWHGAQAAFWYGALSKFIGNVQGHVRVIIEDSETKNEHGQILSMSMVKSMDTSKVSLLEMIVSGDTACDSKSVVELRKAIILRGMKSEQVKCTSTSSVKQSLYCDTEAKSVSGGQSSVFSNSTNVDDKCSDSDDSSGSGMSVVFIIIGFLAGILASCIAGRRSHPSMLGYSEIPTHTQ